MPDTEAGPIILVKGQAKIMKHFATRYRIASDDLWLQLLFKVSEGGFVQFDKLRKSEIHQNVVSCFPNHDSGDLSQMWLDKSQ